MTPLLLPLVVAQGLWVRRTTTMLPPAGGPTIGTARAGTGTPPPLRLAVLGESTAAGCGVDAHADGFAGHLAQELAVRSGRAVRWEAVGQHGATARRIRHRLLPRVGAELDVAVLLAGVNDVLSRRSPEEWGEDLTAIVGGLGERAGRVVVAGIPPFRSFPSLPVTLARYLAGRAEALDEVSARVCGEHARATFVDASGIALGADFFSRDRFHPSARGYAGWAEMVADVLTA